jgi:hypothetical protein
LANHVSEMMKKEEKDLFDHKIVILTSASSLLQREKIVIEKSPKRKKKEIPNPLM